MLNNLGGKYRYKGLSLTKLVPFPKTSVRSCNLNLPQATESPVSHLGNPYFCSRRNSPPRRSANTSLKGSQRGPQVDLQAGCNGDEGA